MTRPYSFRSTLSEVRRRTATTMREHADPDDEILYLAAQALSFEELAGGVARRIAEVFDSPAAMAVELRADGVPEGRVVTGASDLFARYAALTSPSDPLGELKVRLNPRIAVTTSLVDRKRLAHSDPYGLLYGPEGLEHHLALRISATAYGRPGLASIIFCRHRRQRAWSATELRRVGRFLPALEIALTRVRRHASVVDQRSLYEGLIGVEGGAPFGVWDASGVACWLSPRAQRVGLKLRDLNRVDAPASLALRWAELSGRAARFDGDARVWLTTNEGSIRGDLVVWQQPGGGEPLYLLLVESPRQDVAAVERLTSRFALTPSEHRVLVELARGSSNLDIAMALQLSVDTVRTHVHRILKKMRLRSRLQIVTLLHKST